MSTPKSISYSGLSDWEHCSHYYQLVNIKRLKLFENTVWTHWGKLIHKYVQDVLLDKQSPEEASARFKRTWHKFCNLFKEKEMSSLATVGALTVLTIKDRFLEEFGEYEVLDVERYIKTACGFEWPQEFRGFVDIAFKVKSTGKIIIADFKSCKSGYSFKKYKDKFKDYQLTLYKHFLLQEEPDWNSQNTETYFITLERAPASKKPIGFVRVTSGDRKVKNALAWMSNALHFINKGKFLKNRTSCMKYGKDYPCMFKDTEHCT